MSKSTQAQPVPTAATTAEAFQQQGQRLRQRGERARALAAYGQAIALDRSCWPAWFERGDLKLEAGDAVDAVHDLDQAVALAPDQAKVWLILGNACNAAGNSDRALTCFQRATIIDPAYAEAHYNAGVIQYHRGELEAAVASYSAALKHKPDFILAQSNLGVALEAQGETDAALAHYDAAIASAPNDASVRWNKALFLLRSGRYVEAWGLHEWRWADGKAGPLRHYPGRPLWLGGSSIKDKTLLLYAEQGLGDAIQFARYVPMVVAAGARVVLEMFASLKGLFDGISGVQMIYAGDTLPAFDLHCPLMSLPLAFGTTLDTIPQDIPYIVPDPDRVAVWQAQLGTSDRLRVGVVWKGNPKNPGNAARSIPVEVLKGILLEGVDFLCLQNDPAPAEIAVLQPFEHVRVSGRELGDFNNTAALVACCDLVISVDTAMAHLAGAMGKPTWVLLAGRSDWRWLKDRTDSPWYPSARLFRQAQQGEWQGVVNAVRTAVAERAERHCSAQREAKIPE